MKRIKNTDLDVYNICLGTANFGSSKNEEEAFEILDNYVGDGGNFIDTANVYCRWIEGAENCSEKIIGKWLKSRKKEIVVATKGGHYDINNPQISRINKKDILKDLDESLLTLELETIDLYWLHRDDINKPIEEIVDIMEEIVKSGKIRYYGASNYMASRLETAGKYAGKNNLQGFTAVSNEWSYADINSGELGDKTLVKMGEKELDYHRKYLIPSIPYSAGARGFFAKLQKNIELSEGMKSKYLNDENICKYEKLLEKSKEENVSIQALALKQLTEQPFQVIPIVSVSGVQQLEDIFKANKIITN